MAPAANTPATRKNRVGIGSPFVESGVQRSFTDTERRWCKVQPLRRLFDPSPMLRAVPVVFAVANQKGGVAKTTTAHTLGAAFVERGRRVLLVDLDPQAGLTFSAGIDPATLDRSLYDVFLNRTPAIEVLAKSGEL